MIHSYLTRTSNNTDFSVLTTVRVLTNFSHLAVYAPARLFAHDNGLPDMRYDNRSEFILLLISIMTRWVSSPARFLEPNDGRPFVFVLSY